MEPTSGVAWEAEDEWELCNDDGFVYKRKKRPRLDDPAAAQTSKMSAPAVDPEAEEKYRSERKRKALLKLKRRYQREIDQWELLSNTLSDMEEKLTQRFQDRQQEQQQRQREQQKREDVEETASVMGPAGVVRGTEDPFGATLDELLLQAETQEAMIRDVSNLCDVAEAICNAEEERLKQSYFDLPIWGSPDELMASLCDE